MAVPNTNTFSLQDVVNDINPTTDDLVDCFADANQYGFDPVYEGSKDNLYNFRNYCGDATCTTSIAYKFWSASFGNQPQNACIVSGSTLGWVDNGYTFVTAPRFYNDDGKTTLANSNGWYADSGATNLRQIEGGVFTNSGTCLNWVSVLPSTGNSVLYSACGQSLGATKRYYTDSLVATEILYSDAGYTTWTTVTNQYYRYATTGGTNSVGLYFRVNNTTGTVSEVGSCPASTTTTTTTTATDPQALSVSTAVSGTPAGACGLSTPLTVYYDLNAFPGFIGNGMTLYTTSALTTKWNGGNTFDYHKLGTGGRGVVSTVGVVSLFGLCF